MQKKENQLQKKQENSFKFMILIVDISQHAQNSLRKGHHNQIKMKSLQILTQERRNETE